MNPIYISWLWQFYNTKACPSARTSDVNVAVPVFFLPEHRHRREKNSQLRIQLSTHATVGKHFVDNHRWRYFRGKISFALHPCFKKRIRSKIMKKKEMRALLKMIPNEKWFNINIS